MMSTSTNPSKKRRVDVHGKVVDTSSSESTSTPTKKVYSLFLPKSQQPKLPQPHPRAPTVLTHTHLEPFTHSRLSASSTSSVTSVTSTIASSSTATVTAVEQTLSVTATTQAAKIAFYDLDGTLIRTPSGSVVAVDANDWRFCEWNVKAKLMQVHQNGYDIVLISNQKLGGDKRITAWKTKIHLICQKLPELPLQVFAATEKDQFRKPGGGMFELVEAEYLQRGMTIDREASFFVGDAAGRPGDHSDSDLKWALNLGIRFETPEMHFAGAPVRTLRPSSGFDAREWIKATQMAPLVTPSNSPIIPKETHEIVLFVGYPAVGKTSFYKKHFEPRGYVHVNQDTLKSRDGCLRKVRETISLRRSGVVVDNTNRDVATRLLYVELAKVLGVPIRCFFFTAPMALAQHNNIYRAYLATQKPGEKRRELLPPTAFLTFQKNLEIPNEKEGFTEVKNVNFKFEGSVSDREIWKRWTF